eukprot:CAMPEP_0198208318 /NCGR_PEP_ID=MMETSP1445-20131203/11695_1 /TAXON_ID=36898 /ORGANISM="Pyramimonas sp., Strain CCMP2087" /LENGTH=189 /DNA_ID=CAMNT_0043881669 /DNA_START=45 /DNA_END=610 /DNA_ORIENTATION=+
MNATTDREVGVSTLGDIRSAAVVAAQAQIEHTHEVRRCMKRWPVRMKDEMEQYSRPGRQAVSKQGWGYVDTIREDLETEGLQDSKERLQDTISVLIETALNSLGKRLPDEEVDELAENNAIMVQRIIGNMLRDKIPQKPEDFDNGSDKESDKEAAIEGSDNEAEEEPKRKTKGRPQRVAGASTQLVTST